jgi:hypothetical protein
VLAGGNTINNNYNIVNNITQVGLQEEKEISFNNTAPLQGISKTIQEGLDMQILSSLSNKLGYSIEDIKKCVKEDNSFVQVLYNKMVED